MPYPIIMNGDHAEFEAEHKDTPPHERPDWPLPSFDAVDWAKSFMKIVEKGAFVDEAWMTTWFANALMRGYDEASRYPVEFVDMVGHPGKLKLKNGVWCFDGVITN